MVRRFGDTHLETHAKDLNPLGEGEGILAYTGNLVKIHDYILMYGTQCILIA